MTHLRSSLDCVVLQFVLACHAVFVSPALAACTGDCDGSGEVTVAELVDSVGAALGRSKSAGCSAVDPDRDGRVGVENLVEAVFRAQDGCPAMPTVTPTERATGTATRTPAASVTMILAPTPTATQTPMLADVTPSATPTLTATATRTPIPVPTGSDRFRDVALSSQAAMRLVISTSGQLSLLQSVSGRAKGRCEDGGSVEVECAETEGAARRTSVFNDCRSLTAGGNSVIRNGLVIEAVPSCAAPDEPVAVELVRFELEERLGGGEIVLLLSAGLRIAVAPLGIQGCAGPSTSLTLHGTMHAECTAAAETLACVDSIANVEFAATNLRLDRISLGSPCEEVITARGALVVANGAREESFSALFNALSVRRRPGATQNEEELRIEGEMSVDCLGALLLATKSSSPIVLQRGSSCPRAGEITLGRPDHSSPPPADPVLSGALVTPAAGFRQFLFRAASGQVYQVIQNEDAADGADAIQVTSLVGALSSSVAVCSNIADSDSDPMAAAVTGAGSAYPLASIVRSEVVDGTSLPRFNRNAEQGTGRVCIGEECAADAGCPVGGTCASFVFTDGRRIAESEPAARLASPETTCGGFTSRQTYAFGDGGPTLERALCSPSPADGLRLEIGKSLIVAYETQPLELFNVGVAGLPIDTNNENSLCPAAGVLSPGRALSDTAAAPVVAFDERGATLDYDGDGVADRVFEACNTAVAIECVEPGDATPTPTVDPSRPCGATLLDSLSEVLANGSTAGLPSTSGESSCGWGGGNGAPDRVYEYVPPAAGLFDVELQGSDFAPLLYVRSDSCLAGNEELGCDDDVDGNGATRVALQLAAGERIAIVVDGADGRGGSFALRVGRRQPELAIRSVTVAAQPEPFEFGGGIRPD